MPHSNQRSSSLHILRRSISRSPGYEREIRDRTRLAPVQRLQPRVQQADLRANPRRCILSAGTMYDVRSRTKVHRSGVDWQLDVCKCSLPLQRVVLRWVCCCAAGSDALVWTLDPGVWAVVVLSAGGGFRLMWCGCDAGVARLLVLSEIFRLTPF